MKLVTIHWAAKAELAEAIGWYESRLKALGLDLQNEVEAATRRLAQNPQVCSPHKKSGCRKAHVKRFPYVIYFMERPDNIWVAAVAHGARRPGYWKDRQPDQVNP